MITTQRHPLLRLGQREPIPSHIRAAVWFRDHGKCELCGERVPADSPWELDHITPWSAGGSDQSANLRVLCERHNQERSNYVDLFERPRQAVTWWCLTCYGIEQIHAWEWWQGSPYYCPVHTPEAEGCRIIRGYKRAHDATGEYPDWFDRPDAITEDHPLVIAYCAHCDAPGLTDRPL